MAQQAAVPVPTRSGAELDVKGLNGGLGGDFVSLLAWARTLRDNFNNVDAVVAGLQQLIGSTAADSDNIINQAQEVYAFLNGVAEGTPFAAIINGLTQRLVALEAGGGASGGAGGDALVVPLAEGGGLRVGLEAGQPVLAIYKALVLSDVLEELTNLAGLTLQHRPAVTPFYEARKVAFATASNLGLEYSTAAAPDVFTPLTTNNVNGLNVGVVTLADELQHAGAVLCRVRGDGNTFAHSGCAYSPQMLAVGDVAAPNTPNLLPYANELQGPGMNYPYDLGIERDRSKVKAPPAGIGYYNLINCYAMDANFPTAEFAVTPGRSYCFSGYIEVIDQPDFWLLFEPSNELHQAHYNFAGQGTATSTAGDKFSLVSQAFLGPGWERIFLFKYIWIADLDVCRWQLRFPAAVSGQRLLLGDLKINEGENRSNA